MKKYLIFLLLLCLPAVYAQEASVQTISASDGSFNFQIPSEWTYLDLGGGVFAGSSQEAIDHMLSSGEVEAGEIVILAFGQAFMEAQMGVEAGSDLLTQAETLVESAASGQPPMMFAAPELITLPDGRSAAVAQTDESSAVEGGLFVIQASEDASVALVILGTQETLESAGEILLPLVASVQVGSVPLANSASLVWSIEDAFENGGNNIVVVDDIIYGSDGLTKGIVMFSLDGEALGSLEISDNRFRGATDIDVDADGNLWIVGITNEMMQISTAGEVLTVIDAAPNATREIAVAPDGNLVLLAAKEGGSGHVLQIWTSAGELLKDVDVTIADDTVWEMTLGADGNIYLLYLGSGISIYDFEGNLLQEDFASSSLGLFSFYSGFESLSDGTFMVGKKAIEGEDSYEVVHIDADGNLIGRYDNETLGLEEMFGASDFFLLPEGNVLVAESGRESRLFRMTLAPSE